MRTINNNSELGFMWLGRLCLFMEGYDEEEPRLKISSMEKKKIIDTQEYIHKMNKIYQFKVKMYFIVNTPKDDEKYKIKIQWGTYTIDCGKFTAKNGCIEINTRYETPLEQPSSLLPDVFIHLYEDEKILSYKRIKAKLLMHENVE